LASALLTALSLGIPHAAPAGSGSQFADLLLGQARAAWNECTRRMNAIVAAEPKSGIGAAGQLAARLSQLTTAFGGGFRALPQVATSPPDLLARAAAATAVDRTDAGQAPEAWIYKVGHIHSSIGDLLDAWCGAEAMGNGTPLAVAPAQLPLPPVGKTRPWVGQRFGEEPHRANTLSLVFLGASAPASSPMCALLVADWIEVIPSDSEVTAVAYHYDAPTAQAPQSILLAVPARMEATEWTYADLLSTVNAVIDLAHARTVDYADLPGLARLVLPAAYFRNPDQQTAALPATLPPSYLQPVPHADITSVDPVRIIQGKTGDVTVHGSNFAVVKPTDFSVDGDGVTITSGSIDPGGALATLHASVAANATPSARHVHVSSSVSPLASVTVAPTPRATYCDTVQLTQQLFEVIQRVTVTGVGLSGAAVSLTGYDLSPAVVTADTTVLVTVTIPASTYDPNTDGDGRGDSPSYKPRAARQPRHRTVDLKLTVTPTGGDAATFDIKLDTIS
ncbi:MAG TPA: hypothetical protein VHO95_00835, partial [Candidatus Dormibacteraeota bacterium]|nr:hypothetical protein [Candidatus Dormibacteraeota bacterium]